jgi:HEPN domain-containing protein
MRPSDVDKQKLIDFWVAASDEDFDTMHVMFRSKKHHWALFIGHLSVEKLLKAL